MVGLAGLHGLAAMACVIGAYSVALTVKYGHPELPSEALPPEPSI
jgi:hypothetical protein